MKKLLCVLMFGMVFGQTKLETRVYEVDLSLEGDISQNFNLYDKNQINDENRYTIIESLKEAMINSAESLDFEKAARIRDEIAEIETNSK